MIERRADEREIKKNAKNLDKGGGGVVYLQRFFV